MIRIISPPPSPPPTVYCLRNIIGYIESSWWAGYLLTT